MLTQMEFFFSWGTPHTFILSEAATGILSPDDMNSRRR